MEMIDMAPLLYALCTFIPIAFTFTGSQLLSVYYTIKEDKDRYKVYLMGEDYLHAKKLVYGDKIGDILNSGTVTYWAVILGLLILGFEFLDQPYSHWSPAIWFALLLILCGAFISFWHALAELDRGIPLLTKLHRIITDTGIQGQTFQNATDEDLRRYRVSMVVCIALFVPIMMSLFSTTWLYLAAIILTVPAVMIYGQTMGTSWNVLAWTELQRVAGKLGLLDTEKRGLRRRIISSIVLFNVLVMPLLGLNVIISWVIAKGWRSLPLISEGGLTTDQSSFIQGGGLLGEWTTSLGESLGLSESGVSVEFLVPGMIILNVTVIGVGLAFEVFRLRAFGAQYFGTFGSSLKNRGDPLQAITESRKDLRFVLGLFSGYSGFMVLLSLIRTDSELIMLPSFIKNLDLGVMSFNILTLSYTFFLFFWLVSLVGLLRLRRAEFELIETPIEYLIESQNEPGDNDETDDLNNSANKKGPNDDNLQGTLISDDGSWFWTGDEWRPIVELEKWDKTKSRNI